MAGRISIVEFGSGGATGATKVVEQKSVEELRELFKVTVLLVQPAVSVGSLPLRVTKTMAHRCGSCEDCLAMEGSAVRRLSAWRCGLQRTQGAAGRIKRNRSNIFKLEYSPGSKEDMCIAREISTRTQVYGEALSAATCVSSRTQRRITARQQEGVPQPRKWVTKGYGGREVNSFNKQSSVLVM